MKRKIKIIIRVIFILFCFNSVFAKKVEIKLAEQVALNFYLERFNAINHSGLKTVSISERYTVKDNSENVYYVFNIENNGFIIVSADDVVYPVLGYSFESTYGAQNQPPQFIYWMDTYKLQISNAIKSKLSSTPEIESEWARLKVKPDEFSSEKNIKAITPLLLSTWDQGSCYNALCPLDATSSTGNGRVWAGCVATSMAQVMYYYRYPIQGQSSHSYYSSYGPLSANFGGTTYNWNAMTNSCSGTNTAIATLMYHCGVSVNMDYGPDGSSADMGNAAYSLVTYFKYSSGIQYKQKDNYTVTQWENILKNELNNKRPMMYAGHSIAGGHAFVCDGYQGTNYFHFNWGWSGYYNGYFYLNALNPGGNDFTQYQQAICNIYPGSAYPYYCTGTKTLTSTIGSFEDGSGPSNYQNNSNCSWLIAPACAGHINLFFDDFSSEAVNDVMTIYNGSNASAPVLATVSGTTFPSSVSSTGPAMFIKFTTNGSLASSGWHVNYTTTFPVYCGITTLNAASDTFTDGSGNCNYNISTVCQWLIEPTNAGSVTLHFTDFNTEPVNDFVKIVDPVTSTVLATYSGTNIPASVTSNSGKMRIYFVSNSSITAAGWTAYYTSTPFTGLEDFNTVKELSVYPNPVNDKLHVSFSIIGVNDALIDLINISGKIVCSEKINIASGIFTKDFDVSLLAKGIYNLRIITSDETINKKVVIE